MIHTYWGSVWFVGRVTLVLVMMDYLQRSSAGCFWVETGQRPEENHPHCLGMGVEFNMDGGEG